MSIGMKWYIFDKDHHPVCWSNEDGDCPACEFDTKEDAQAFLEGILTIPAVANDFAAAVVENCIFFYDDGKINMSGLRPVANGDNIELERWRFKN